jgi:RimJ/RimL family protein N-acetyltransferase
VILRAPTREECQQVRLWRNDPAVLPMLRTKEPLTEAQQDAFYERIKQGNWWPHAYVALEEDGRFVGLGGITHIRAGEQGEISLILGPEFRGKGYGAKAVAVLLAWAKDALGLRFVVGECYKTGNLAFWLKVLMGKPRASWEWNHEGSLLWRWTL